MPSSRWKHTAIYQKLLTLSGSGTESVLNLLGRPEAMDAIETILEKSGTAPRNFTLHDADHGFRVAQRIWELIPARTREALTCYEWGLLLFSAYLHDIGMSPAFETWQRHYDLLVAEKDAPGSTEKQLTESDSEFQRWIDIYGGIGTFDLRKNRITDHHEAERVMSYYVRFKHNDWSGDWIRTNLTRATLPRYERWQEDLIRLCRSHHEGIGHLKQPNFDPRPVGDDSHVHLRYLAMVLRVADVMEVDPERAPALILEHRAIDPSSRPYWEKDRQFQLRRDGIQFVVIARPERAYLHKAILETAQQIEQELKLCVELISAQPLNHSSFLQLRGYEWDIDAYVRRDVQPAPGTYIFMQGGFRPNTGRLLELLAGHQLYGDPIAAIRELLQNAFDAVKERIAWQIVTHEDWDPVQYKRKLGELYSVEMRLEQRPEGAWLICRDSGVGMTSDIIEHVFLESGAPQRAEIFDLHRRCRDRGFIFDRTGQFGIGVLSYFMIAESIVVRTRRESNTGYPAEANGWQFEIGGLYDFGELREDREITGTEISFKLRPDIAGDLAAWDKKLRTFLRAGVVNTPCSVAYKSQEDTIVLPAGWTHLNHWMTESLVDTFGRFYRSKIKNAAYYGNPVPNEKFDLETAIIEEEMWEIADFIHETGDLPGIGEYQIHIPFFRLPGGECLTFMRARETDGEIELQQFEWADYWKPNFGRVAFALNGMAVDARYAKESHEDDYPRLYWDNAYVEINVQQIAKGDISVSRDSIILTERVRAAVDKLDYRILDLIIESSVNWTSRYGTMNHIYTRVIPSQVYWACIDSLPSEEYGRIIWREIRFPYIVFKTLKAAPTLYFRGQSLQITLEMNELDKDSYHTGSCPIYREAQFALGIVLSGKKLPFEFVIEGEKGKPGDYSIYQPRAIELSTTLDWLWAITTRQFERYFINQSLGLDLRKLAWLNEKPGKLDEADLRDRDHCVYFLIARAASSAYDVWHDWVKENLKLAEHAFRVAGVEAFFIMDLENIYKVTLEGKSETSNGFAPLMTAAADPRFLLLEDPGKKTDQE